MKLIEDRLTAEDLEDRLRHFERLYAMTSDQFAKGYYAGIHPDSDDFAEWEETYSTLGRLRGRDRCAV